MCSARVQMMNNFLDVHVRETLYFIATGVNLQTCNSKAQFANYNRSDNIKKLRVRYGYFHTTNQCQMNIVHEEME